MSDTPSRNPVMQRLEALLAGGGYNFYDKANLARADDLLVRQRAGHSLGEAAAHLRQMETEYRQVFLPPVTREQPLPPAGAMAKVRGLTRLAEQVRGLESDIRGMAAPAQDKFWGRLRSEMSLLNALIAFDDGLLQSAADISRVVQGWTAERWHAEDLAAAIASPLSQMAQLTRDRQQLLLSPI